MCLARLAPRSVASDKLTVGESQHERTRLISTWGLGPGRSESGRLVPQSWHAPGGYPLGLEVVKRVSPFRQTSQHQTAASISVPARASPSAASCADYSEVRQDCSRTELGENCN